MKFNRLKLFIPAILCHIFNSLHSQDWSMFGANNAHTSYVTGDTTLNPPYQTAENILKYDFGVVDVFSIHDTLMVLGVTGGDTNTFYGIGMNSKDILWNFPMIGAAGSIGFIPAQNESVVLLGAQYGAGLFCVNRLTGEQIWFKKTASLHEKHPVIDDNRVYILSDTLYCLEIATGDTIWTQNQIGQYSPAIDESHCYVTSNNETVAYNKLTGERIWTKYNSKSSFGAAVVDELFLYTHSNDSLIARNKITGEIEWAYQIPGAEMEYNCIAVNNQIITVSTIESSGGVGEMYALDKTNGNFLWSYTASFPFMSPATIVNDMVFVMEKINEYYTASLIAFDAPSGRVLHIEEGNYRSFRQPVVARGKIFVFTSNLSTIYEISNPPADITSVTDFTFLNAHSNDKLQVFPNPVTDICQLLFSVSEAQPFTLSIHDVQGRKVSDVFENKTFQVGTHTETIQIDQRLSAGVYTLVLQSTYGERSIQVLID